MSEWGTRVPRIQPERSETHSLAKLPSVAAASPSAEPLPGTAVSDSGGLSEAESPEAADMSIKTESIKARMASLASSSLPTPQRSLASSLRLGRSWRRRSGSDNPYLLPGHVYGAIDPSRRVVDIQAEKRSTEMRFQLEKALAQNEYLVQVLETYEGNEQKFAKTIDSFRRTQSDHESDTRKFQATVDAAAKKIHLLKTQLSASQQGCRDLAQEFSRQQEKFDKLQDAARLSKESENKFQGQVLQYAEVQSELVSEAERLRDEIRNLQLESSEKAQTCRREVEDLRRALRDERQTTESLRGELLIVSEKHKLACGSAESLQQRLQALTATLHGLEDLKGRHEILKEELYESKKCVARYQSEVVQAEADKARLTKEVGTLTAELFDLGQRVHVQETLHRQERVEFTSPHKRRAWLVLHTVNVFPRGNSRRLGDHNAFASNLQGSGCNLGPRPPSARTTTDTTPLEWTVMDQLQLSNERDQLQVELSRGKGHSRSGQELERKKSIGKRLDAIDLKLRQHRRPL
ncbi:MAG: hypothetical protein KVP17_004048 [Porospora cf. gigantea B]|uniref:uncharacterized protein n=1 Tax=Porospora cf. gigantea B TaxID=2853592 RepID=UPI003571C2E3|nr:MAG: hypothetical protein KVP17_004048 [Porospora cf. gigantea B]